MSVYKKVAADPSFWLILAANLFTIFQIATQRIELADVFWVFWFQSILIGVFAIIKLIYLRAPDLAFFFVFHYGIFHLGYFAFIWLDFGSPDMSNIFMLFPPFVLAHSTSAFYFRNELESMEADDEFLLPYARVVPMHVAIFVASNLLSAVVLIAIKTFFDLLSHVIIHSRD